jgi:hypothetical protein
MYIRRKVFSRVIDENGEERYFSTTELEQREFGNPQNKRLNREWAIEQELGKTKDAKRLKKLEGEAGIFDFKKKNEISDIKQRMQNIREAATDKDIVTQTELLRKSRERSKPAQQSTLQERYENLDPQTKKAIKKKVNAKKLEREIKDRETTEAIHNARIQRESEIKQERKAKKQAAKIEREQILENEAKKKAAIEEKRKLRAKNKPTPEPTLKERYENLDPQKKEELKRRVENRKLQDKKKGSIMYKISDNAKKVWNGDKGLGKVGNRAAIIGTGVAATGATLYGIHKARQNRKNKEKEREYKE